MNGNETRMNISQSISQIKLSYSINLLENIQYLYLSPAACIPHIQESESEIPRSLNFEGQNDSLYQKQAFAQERLKS